MTEQVTFALGGGREALAEVRNPGGASGRAVLLPGLSYGCDKPLLAELSRELQRRGLEVLEMRLPYGADADFKALTREAQLVALAEDGRALLAGLGNPAPEKPLVLAGKSLGTLMLGGMAEAGLPENARPIWLTPSLRNTALLRQMRAAGRPAFSLIGARDPSVDITRSLPFGQIEGLSHLEVGGMDHAWRHMDGDEASLRGLAQAVVGMGRWLDQALDG